MDSLCWFCENAYGHCRWSERFEPVAGWVAKRNDLPDIEGSYFVMWCPRFKEDKRMLEEDE